MRGIRVDARIALTSDDAHPACAFDSLAPFRPLPRQWTDNAGGNPTAHSSSNTKE